MGAKEEVLVFFPTPPSPVAVRLTPVALMMNGSMCVCVGVGGCARVCVF